MAEMDKLKRLRQILLDLGSVAIAFSGGVDSSFLLKMARDVLEKDNVLAVTAVSDTYTSSELSQAKRFTRSLDVKHKIIFTDELNDASFAKNPTDRCYYCKKELFKKLSCLAKRNGLEFVVDASNVDDKKDYRPGSRAKLEFGVRSPIQEAGITKSDIRKFSKSLDLKTWDLPSMACLASRIPYGQEIRKETLRKIETAEAFIKKCGIKQVRVRYHNDIARIEVEKKDIKKFVNHKLCDRIIKRLKSLGFHYIVLDLEGYRTGSLNERLQ
ncbi:ATP-dependent sacrificial sulfur transferase LarE [Candidatus Omnitrophota bacterium]